MQFVLASGSWEL